MVELQIRGVIEDNSQIILFISQQKHMLRPPLELSQRDDFNDGSQNTFLWKNMASYH